MIPARILPPKALILGVTPLLDARFVATIADLRARGFDLAVVEVDPVPLVARGRTDVAAARLPAVAPRPRGAPREARQARHRRRALERRHGARRSARGGEDVPTPRQGRTRVATGAGVRRLHGGGRGVVALADAGDLALHGRRPPGRARARHARRGRRARLEPARASGAPPPRRRVRDAPGSSTTLALDTRAPLLAAGLYLASELAYWSLEERARVQGDAGRGPPPPRASWRCSALGRPRRRRALLAVADLARAEGLAVDLLGALAAAGVLLVVTLYARRPG